MARPKKPSEKVKASSLLLEALNSFDGITKPEGTPYETHVLLSNKTIVAYNDFLSAGAIVIDDIYCAANSKLLQTALSKCGQEPYNLVIDGVKIVLKAGKFKASIPCIDPALLSLRYPDNPSYSISDDFRLALSCMDLIKPEPNASRIHLLSFLINGKSCISTDGKIIIEYWHGFDLPTIAIPKIIIQPILKNPRKLVSLGYSENSCTFFFEDNSWVKSQLINGEWPIETIQTILNKNSNAIAVPPDFYKALTSVVSFSPTGQVFFKTGLLCSHPSEDTGATHEVKELLSGPVYSSKYLMIVKDYAEAIDFYIPAKDMVSDNNAYMCYFFGKNIRGVIAGHG